MKPFDLEKALAGEKVVTRIGKDATQLTMLDDESLYPLRATLNGYVCSFNTNGRYNVGKETEYDLFMAEPERWVNVYWCERRKQLETGSIYSSEAEAIERIDVSDGTIYQTTIKLK